MYYTQEQIDRANQADLVSFLQGQMKVNKTLDTYYDLIEIYKGLDEYDQEMVWSIMQTVKKTCEKRKRDKENTEES